MSDREKRSGTRRLYVLCASLAFTVAPGVANCQDAGSPSSDSAEGIDQDDPRGDDSVEEIVVVGVEIGSGTVRSNQTISAELIEEMPPLVAPLSMIDRLPGVNVGSADAYGGDDWSGSFDIRGFDRNQIGFVVDGLPVGSTGYNSGSRPNRWVEAENLESVSVYQGASNIGAPTTQSLGGSVVYTTRGPEEEFGGQVSFTGGDQNMQRYFLRIDSGPIVGSNTYMYASYSDTNYDHWMDYGADAISKREHAEIALLHELGDGNSLELKYTYNDRFTHNYNQVSTEQWLENPWDDGIHGPWTGNPLIDGYNAEGWADPRTDEMINFEGNFKLPYEFDAKVIAYHHKGTGPGYWPWECTMHPDDLFSPTLGPTVCNRDENGVATVSTMYISQYPKDRDGLTLEFSKSIGEHDITFGAWYEQLDRFNSRTYHDIVDPETGPEWDPTPYWMEYQREFNTETTMAFVADSVNLLDGRLLVNGGLTVTNVRIDYTNHLEEDEQPNQYDSDWSLAPRFGARYYLSPSIEIYGSYSRNFKMLQDTELQDRDVTNVDTETADSLDVGLRFTNDWLRATVGAYSIDFDNRIVDFNFTIPPEEQGSRAYEADGVQINAGGQKSVGVEVSADIRLSDRLGLYMSASRNSGDSVNVVSIETDARGDLVSAVWSASTRDDLGFFSELTYQTDRLRIALNAAYEGEREGDLEGSSPAPSYWLWGANAKYLVFDDRDGLFKSLSLNLNIHNLFDEPYLSGVPRQGLWYVGSPRAAIFTVSSEF